MLRELGVLLTAIMVAGRTGSAYAAEIGVMKLNEEVDALESMGLDPYEVLVLPRVLGLVIALPLLTIVADFMGLAGGGLLTRYLIDLPWPQFFMRLDEALARTTFWAGLIKAPVFGVLIALTGTLRGLQVRESSRELGPAHDRRGRAVHLPRHLRGRAVRDLLPRDRLLSRPVTQQPVISVRDIVNRFGTQVVHDGVSFDAYRGEVFGIVGGSGSGKSVLLRTLLGLRRPDAGRVEVEGREITAMEPGELREVKRRYGVTFQHGALFSSLTVAENITLPVVEAFDLDEGAARAARRAASADGRPPGRGGRQVPRAIVRRHGEARRTRAGAGTRSRPAVPRRTHRGARPHRCRGVR